MFKLSISSPYSWPVDEHIFPRQAPATVLLLPSLKELFGISGVTVDHVVRLVTERRDAGVPLRAIFMKRCSVMEFNDVVWLRDNLEEFGIMERDPSTSTARVFISDW